jgi:hypothetical protein
MRAIFAPIAAAALTIGAAVPAYADVTYDFIPTSAENNATPYSTWQPIPLWQVPLQVLIFSDAAVESGSVSTPNPYIHMDASSGLVGGQVGLCPITICTIQPDYDFPTCYVEGGFSLMFNANGTLSGIISPGISSGANLGWGEVAGTGTGGNWAISIGQDGVQVGIRALGYWYTPPRDLPHPDPVPEPSSLALMLSAIGATIGVGLRRSRT